VRVQTRNDDEAQQSYSEEERRRINRAGTAAEGRGRPVPTDMNDMTLRVEGLGWHGPIALLAVVFFLIPSHVEGQGTPRGTDVVERVVAVVGDSVVLLTEVEEFLLSMEARGWSRPTGPAELLEAQREVLEQLINQQVILQEASKDSLLAVTEEELEDRVQQEIDGQVRQFGTLGRLQQALAEQNMTMAVYREQRKNLIRSQLLQERFFAKGGQSETDIIVTDEEARAYFDENQELFPRRPPSIRFENVQLLPEPSDSAKAEALAEADSVRELLADGGDFEELARRFSDGPSAESGGELGWMREDGSFVEAFEEVAFLTPPGLIGPPVETQFGYHLILVERVRGGERRVRHILIQPGITASDIDANDARAESFAARLRAGETMADLGLEPDTADLPIEQIAQASQSFAATIQLAQVGEVVGPVTIEDARTENGWTLARVLDKTPGGVPEFLGFRDLVVERLTNQRLTERVVERLRSQAHVDIRLGGG
jgi:peptidyl-prolyl cis-trans isomerase SurA